MIRKTLTLIRALQVFLASERTFFSWLRVSLLLGSFALALFNGGDNIGRYMGVVYAIISMLAVSVGTFNSVVSTDVKYDRSSTPGRCSREGRIGYERRTQGTLVRSLVYR